MMDPRYNGIERRLRYLEEKSITRDIPYEEKLAIREIIEDSIIDIVWDKYYYISESEPASLSGTQAYAEGETNNQATLSIRKPSRFRSVINVLTLGDSDMYLTSFHVRPVDIAYTPAKDTGEWAGIIITPAGKMIARTQQKKSYSTLVLDESVRQGEDYTIEMRFFPRERVDFYVNGELRGSISRTLPSDQNLEIYEWAHAYVSSGTSNLDIQRAEFIQENIFYA